MRAGVQYSLVISPWYCFSASVRSERRPCETVEAECIVSYQCVSMYAWRSSGGRLLNSSTVLRPLCCCDILCVFCAVLRLFLFEHHQDSGLLEFMSGVKSSRHLPESFFPFSKFASGNRRLTRRTWSEQACCCQGDLVFICPAGLSTLPLSPLASFGVHRLHHSHPQVTRENLQLPKWAAPFTPLSNANYKRTFNRFISILWMRAISTEYPQIQSITSMYIPQTI